MLQSHLRFMRLYILFLVYQLDFSDGTNGLRILELKGKDFQNILPLYLDQINKSPNHRYMIVIYNSTARNIPENQNELNTNHNFRRMHMGLYFEQSELLLKQRKRREDRKKQQTFLWHIQHRKRLDYINQTLINRFKPTIYLYYEMKRILRDRKLFDPLRRMIVHLERPGNENIKAAVLNCYHKVKPPKEVNGWEMFDTNNLVKNLVRDPFNDNLY